MQLVSTASFDEMIALYLRAELTGRFGTQVEAQLEREGASRSVVESPDTTSPTECALRRRVLAGYRAYLFDDLPEHVQWYRATLPPTEVAMVRYMDYSYWNELSRHTRLPRVAAEAIRSGEEVFGVSNAGFLKAAQALRAGAHFPELILVAASPRSPLTVLEGHVRLTAYLLAPEYLPEALPVLVGFAPECAGI
ncbi:hypothetical protein [Armatimonas rosea]|uniref:Uncharacterized protein n=1 Tax=Armatimonas rosea TaxID=685828 RepID=A0A7W9SNH7_ARMRO|nr:hypothetical protein [Armatimonas rosea]MBB6049866.1 hypothetical protein [Armatimonas rosea]